MSSGLEGSANLGRGDRIDHQAWNAVARHVLGKATPATSGRSARRPGAEAGLSIWVRNDTGAALAPHEVVRIGDPVVDLSVKPLSFQGRPVFKGLATSGFDDRFAITVGAIAVDGFGLAILSGMAVAKVNVGDEEHEWAFPESGSAVLKSGTEGEEIFYKPTGTGVLTCVVVLGGNAANSGVWVPIPYPCDDNGTLKFMYRMVKVLDAEGETTGCAVPPDCGCDDIPGDCGEIKCLPENPPAALCITFDPDGDYCTGSLAHRRWPLRRLIHSGEHFWGTSPNFPIGSEVCCIFPTGSDCEKAGDQSIWYMSLGCNCGVYQARLYSLNGGSVFDNPDVISHNPLVLRGTFTLETGPPATIEYLIEEGECGSSPPSGAYPDACFQASPCGSSSPGAVLCLNDTATFTGCYGSDPDDPLTSRTFSASINGGADVPLSSIDGGIDNGAGNGSFTPVQPSADYDVGDTICIKYKVDTATDTDTDDEAANCGVGQKVCYEVRYCSENSCLWEWDGAAWNVIIDNCDPMLACSPPMSSGSFVGETTETSCS